MQAQENSTRFVKLGNVDELSTYTDIILVSEKYGKAAGSLLANGYMEAIDIDQTDTIPIIDEESRITVFQLHTLSDGYRLQLNGKYLSTKDKKFEWVSKASEASKWKIIEKDGELVLKESIYYIIYENWEEKNRFTYNTNVLDSDYAHLYVRAAAPTPPATITIGDNIADNTDIITNYIGKTADITLQRTFLADGGWYTLCLPFSLTADDLRQVLHAADVRMLTDVQTPVEGSALLVFSPVSSTEAGKPYLVQVADDTTCPIFTDKTITAGQPLSVSVGNNYAMTGIYDATSFSDTDTDCVRFLSGSDGLTLRKPAAEGRLKPFRAYFRLPKGTTQADILFTATTVSTPSLASADTVAYDLLGRYASNTRLRIVKGRKVIAY